MVPSRDINSTNRSFPSEWLVYMCVHGEETDWVIWEISCGMSVHTPIWILCAGNEEESLATQVLDRSKQLKQFILGEGGLFNVKC